MNNKYKIFVDGVAVYALFSIIVIFQVILVVMLVHGDKGSISEILSGIGNVTSGVASVMAAAAALSGLATWKRQIVYGKYIDLIWKAQLACQAVRVYEMSYFIASATPKPTVEHLMQQYEAQRKHAPLMRKETERSLIDLINACQKIDQLVTKSNVAWTVRANRLNFNFMKMANEFDSHDPDYNSVHSDLRVEVYGSIESLMLDLNDLEAQYK